MLGSWRRHHALGATREEVAARVHEDQVGPHLVLDVVLPLLLAVAALVIPIDLTVASRIGIALTIALSIPFGIVVTAVAPPAWSITAGTLLRVVAACSLTFFAPIVWIPALVYVAAVSAAMAALLARNDAAWVGVVGSLGLIASALVTGRSDWLPAFIVLAMGLFAIRRWSSEWRHQREETDRQFDDLIDTANLIFWEVDMSEQRLVSMTGNCLGTLGYTSEEILEFGWFDLIHPDDEDVMRVELTEGRPRAGERLELTIRLTHRDGRIVTTRHLVRRSPKGTLIGAAVDVSELASATDALRHQAHHDMLTGLPNRLLLTETLDEAFRSLGGDAPTDAIALLLFDLDGFKGINDTLGHGTGDQVLQVLAKRFQRSLPEAGLCARVGGDEFALVLVGKVTVEQAMACGVKLVQLIEDPLQLAGLRLSVKSSVGIALAPAHATGAEQLMQRADIALYQAKDSADKICLFETTPEEISMERLQLSADIPDALDRGEFELWFQPKVNLADGTIVGAEGLARWRHSERGVLMPGDFLPLLGVSGSYQGFTDQVVAKGIEFAGACHRAARPLSVAINLGSVSFLDTGLPERIARLLEVHQVAPEYLILEVTEDELLLDRDSSSDVFTALEQLGVQLSIDDFGTGYSSLSRLRGLHIQEVKIDRSFVSGLGTDPEDRAIVCTIIELSDRLGKSTVAEGIETVEQLEILRSVGCELGQGFLFDRALPVAEFFDLLARDESYFDRQGLDAAALRRSESSSIHQVSPGA